MPVLTILGSGTLVPDADRYSSAHHLRAGPASFLLDCGPGTAQGLARYGVGWRDLSHVALSHFHNDHVGDLAAVMFALRHGLRSARTEPLTLLGPAGLGDFLERLASALGSHVTDPGFELRVVEMSPGDSFEEPGHDLTLTCHATPHTSESVAYRLEGSWGALGYTGDTGPSNDVAAFLEGCDVLLAECNVPDTDAIETHLSPKSLAALASVARPDLLAVVHVGPEHTPEEAVACVSELYGGAVVAGRDGMRIALGPDGPAVDPLTAAR